MVYDAHKPTWNFPSLIIYAWPSDQSTPESQVIRLSLKHYYTPGDEFALLVRTNDTWSIKLMPNLHPSAPSRALPYLRTLGIFLWPVLFHNFLGAAGLAGVSLLWVCILTTGYASITVAVTQVLISQNIGEIRLRQGAAQRWEREGWVDMGLNIEDCREESKMDAERFY